MKHKSELSAYLGLVQSLEWRQVCSNHGALQSFMERTIFRVLRNNPGFTGFFQFSQRNPQNFFTSTYRRPLSATTTNRQFSFLQYFTILETSVTRYRFRRTTIDSLPLLWSACPTNRKTFTF